VKDKLFLDADFSANTVYTALRGASQVTELYPKEFEQSYCQKTQRNDEYDMLTPIKLFEYPVRGMPMGPLISSCPAEKAR
jgi:hypothetical protein